MYTHSANLLIKNPGSKFTGLTSLKKMLYPSDSFMTTQYPLMSIRNIITDERPKLYQHFYIILDKVVFPVDGTYRS